MSDITDQELDEYITEQAELPPEEPDNGDAPNVDASSTDGDDKPSTTEEVVTTEVTTPATETPVTTEPVLPTLADGVTKASFGGYVNDKGDVVEADGTIIAKQGFARRMHEVATRSRDRIQQQDEHINNIETQLQERNNIQQTIQQSGISNSDALEALEYAARIKRGDLLGVAKDVVALVAAQGYNISDILGDDVGNSIDMKAMKNLLDQRLGPIEQQRNDAQAVTDQQLGAQREYRTFMQANQFADVHEESIVHIMKDQQCNPQQAYNQIMKFANTNGYDTSQPLGPQIEGRQKQGGTAQPNPQSQQEQVQQTNQPVTRAMPHNGAHTQGDLGVQTPPTIYSDPNDSWGEIVAEVQRAAKQQ